MNRFRSLISFVGIVVWAVMSGDLWAAPTFSNGGGPGETNDLFDIALGTQIIVSTPQHHICCGESDPRAILGGTVTSGWVEPESSIFEDGGTLGQVDTVEWQTATPVNLTGIALRLQQDGAGNPIRAATRFRLSASVDGQTFSQISGGTIPGAPGANRDVPLLITDTALTGTTTNVRAFRLDVNRASSYGVRILEMDGQGSPGEASGLFLDRLLFNAASNRLTGRGNAASDDEGPGGARHFTASSRLSGVDTIEDAFGNANGAVEPESFIFEDGGVPDNGNQILGDGGETVDYLQWQLADPASVAGYRLSLSGDGSQGNRSTQLVRFWIDGEEADFFDNRGSSGAVTRVFPDGAKVGSEFRLELTRTTASGPRIIEIDAITGPAAPLNGELVLNEIVSLNAGSLRDEDGDSSDWIELFNGRDVAVSLAGWGLSDDAARPFRWTFPAVTLAPHTYLVVFASGKDRRLLGANLHTNFQLKSTGERIVLTQPGGLIRDMAEPVALREDVSYGRYPNGKGAWKFLANPTPRRSNVPQLPYDSIVFDTPVVTPVAGFRPNPFAATITTSEPDVTLHYTLDGSEPTEESPIYLAPIPIASRAGETNYWSMIPGTSTANQHTDGWKPPRGEVRKATVLRVRATRPGALPGPVGSQTFFVGADAVRTDGLPTISITTNPSGLFDYETGIYMLGAVFDQYVATHPGEALTGHTPANYTQRGSEWERAAHLEWFEPTGERALSEPVLIDIQGQSSRSFRQKSFGIKAQGLGSPRHTFVYPVFPGLTRLGDGTPLTEFQGLRLRNLGNDWDYAFMRDDWCHRLAAGLGLNLMSSRYASVYLDGEYWGVLAVREQEDPNYIEAHYGVDHDEVVILSGAGGLEEGLLGDERPWLDLLQYCETHDLAVPANYDHVASQLDPQDALLYYLSEIYFGNADWPQNNIRVWRRRLATPEVALGPGHDGRWRWFLFDVDLGAAHPWSAGVGDQTLAAALSPTGRPGFNSSWGTAVFRALMTNPAWKQEFLRTAADLLNSWYTANRATGLVDTMKAELKPAMDEHIRRWQANGGNIAAWETRVRSLRDFAAQRTPILRQQMITQFGLRGSSRLIFDVNDATRGTIRVNRLLLDSALPGVTATVFPWASFYFTGVPVTIEARPAPGWHLDHWVGVASDEPEVQVTPSGNTNMTAVFVADLPRLLQAELQADELRLVWSGTPNAGYPLEVSLDLKAWSEAGEIQCGADGRAEIRLPLPGWEEQRFFRAITR